MTTQSIYEVPHIKELWLAERAETDPDRKRALHRDWCIAVKCEQIHRGQRTKMTYRRQKKSA